MAQILNDAPGIGALLGTGIGQGLSSGLQQLAQIKTNQMLSRHQQRQTSQGLQALGFSPQESQQISLLPQDLQSAVLKNYLQAAQSAGLEDALRGVQVNPQSESGISGLDQLMLAEATPQPSHIPQQRLGQMLGITEPKILDKELPTEKAFRNILSQPTQVHPKQALPQAAQSAQRQTQQQVPGQKTPSNKLADILQRPRLTPEHRLKVEALKQQRDIAQNKLNAKEQEEVNKETKPVYDSIQKGANAAKDNNMRLSRMEELIKKGELSGATQSAFVKTLGEGLNIAGLLHIPGLDFSALLTPDSQEFEKLSNDFVKNAKDHFGSRLTDADLKIFMKTIPSSTQSKEGQERVIKNLRAFNEAALLKKSASDRILKENGGKRPRNYELLIEELTKNDLDKLAARFKAGL